MAERAAATPPFPFCHCEPSLNCHCEPLSLPLRRQGVAISGKSKLKNQKAKRQSKNQKIKEMKFL